MPHPSLSVFTQEVLFPNHAMDEEYLDQQLSQVTGFWADGDLPGIVEQVQQLIDQEIYDLRFTSYYFYGLWVTSDTCELVDVLESLLHLLKQDSDVWLPNGISLEKTEGTADELQASRLIQTCLGMLFKRINQRLRRFANEEGAEESEPCRIIELCNELTEVLDKDLGVLGVVGNLTEVSRFHQGACQEFQLEEDNLQQIDDVSLPEAVEASEQHAVVAVAAQTSPENLHSIPLQQLLNKIQMFESLMKKEELYKAAIVYEEIQKELNNFNPLSYLPKLFSQFAGIRALHAGQLTELVEQNNTVQWRALKEYFIADPEGYQQLQIDTESLIENGGRSESDSYNSSRHQQEDDFDDFGLTAGQYQGQANKSRLFDDD